MNEDRPQVSERIAGTSVPIMQVMKDLGKNAVHDLTQGVPFFPPPGGAVESALEDVSGLHRYGPDGGDPDLKEQISQKLRMENGIKASPEEGIMVTSGANMGFVKAVSAVCDPGDEVILLSPYYFNHFMTLDMLGIEKKICPLNDDLLPDLGYLRSSIGPRTRALVLVSPNNPSGMSYPADIVDELVSFCRENGIWLISDETYDRFVFQTEHTSPASLSPEAPVISLFSFSKVFGISGWRVGYMTYPEMLQDSLLKVQDTTVICPSRVSQRLAFHCLKEHGGYVERYLPELDRSRRRLIEWRSVKSDISGPDPNGAFYMFFRYLPKKGFKNSLDLARYVYERCGVLLVPGDPFGESDPPSLRVSYGNIRYDELNEALELLDTVFH